MEDQLHEETENVSPINLNEEMQYYLYQTAKWGKFLSIVGFVFLGFMVVLAFSITTLISSMGMVNPRMGAMPSMGKFVSFFYLLMAVGYFFPTFYLYRFSTKIKSGINNGSEIELTEAFSNLKSVYKFWGILTLVLIIFYTLMLIAIIAGGMMFMRTVHPSGGNVL